MLYWGKLRDICINQTIFGISALPDSSPPRSTAIAPQPRSSDMQPRRRPRITAPPPRRSATDPQIEFLSGATPRDPLNLNELIKSEFIEEVSRVVVKMLDPFRRPEVKRGHIKTKEEFKKLAKKVSLGLISKAGTFVVILQF